MERQPPLVVTENGAVLTVAGELDLATAPILERGLTDVTGPVRLDLEAVTFIDSAGIAAVVRLYKRCQGDGCRLRIENCSRQVERVLRIAGLYELLTEGGHEGDDTPG